MSFDRYFNHRTREAEIYEAWERAGVFRADALSKQPPFSIAMPPPNATGTLHLGHAVMLVIQDVMARSRRMQGHNVLWLPGTDHASIATESVVIRQLQNEGIADPRKTLGRDALVKRIAGFVEQSQSTIRAQVRAMGASCDWSRERYTLDATLSRCVSAVFARMFRDGLIYRGPRIVNWDVALQTTISDDEIDHRERDAELFYIKYGPFVVATSRPETKLGDTAVAVHPTDERYAQYVGTTHEIQWPGGVVIRIKVVADHRVDPETGSGVLGVTPAHSQIDFDIARANGLPMTQVIGEDGRMTAAAGAYAGLSVEECRARFVHDLESAGLLIRRTTYLQPVAICYRSGKPVEALPKNQWFIDVNRPAVPWRGSLLSLKQVMREVVESGQIRLVPERETSKYFNWIDNLRDWCISRQIWWGHRVPAWQRGDEVYVGHREPGGIGWVQDSDTLDTWFSSALWTWSTLIDSDVAADESLDLAQLLAASPDYATFHPTSVMETGHDILFFWVARMILMTTYATGSVPFRTVYLHGMVLDEDGEKMTKSKPEKCIDPLETIEESGTDSLRLSLLIGSSAGHDLRLGKDRIDASRHFANKIWNAAKLVERLVGHATAVTDVDPSHPVSRWALTRSSELADAVQSQLESYEFGVAAETIRHSLWGDFCDFYLEAAKRGLAGSVEETRWVASRVFDRYLALLHPFMPFVTEEIWGALGHDTLLATSQWPTPDDPGSWTEDSDGVDTVMRSINAARRIRQDNGVAPEERITVRIYPTRHHATFDACASIVAALVHAESVGISGEEPTQYQGTSVHIDSAFVLAVDKSGDSEQREHRRLDKQRMVLVKHESALSNQLRNDEFLNKAAPSVVAAARTKHEEVRSALDRVERRLAEIDAGGFANRSSELDARAVGALEDIVP